MDLPKKLQLRPDQHVEGVAVPPSVAAELPGCDRNHDHTVEDALVVFVADRATLEAHRATIVGAAAADRLTWVAYPKARQLGTDLNRDTVAAQLQESGIQPVRQIAVDDVWSALRFRPG
jgi:hypothetical protein